MMMGMLYRKGYMKDRHLFLILTLRWILSLMNYIDAVEVKE